VDGILLALHAVTYTYPGTSQPCLRQVNLAIPAGQKTVVLGRNGCGKSTLLLVMAGLYPVQEGVITWRGQPLPAKKRLTWEWRRRIGLILQNPEHQLVAATVAEDIAYGLGNLGLDRATVGKRLLQTLTDFDLHDLAQTPLHHLSLGQKRRVALAGVMALAPELLLLDEPTTYLDYPQTQTLFQHLARIHAQGTTLVMATHDLDLAYAWADWVILLEAGEVVCAEQADRFWANRELLAAYPLGRPTLLAAWEALPADWRGNRPPPKTLTAWDTCWRRG